LRDNLANSPKYWQRAFDFFAAGGRRPVLFGAPTCVFLAHRPSVDANVQYPGRVTAASTWQARNAAFVTDSLFFGQQISEPARVHGDRAADPRPQDQLANPRGGRPLPAAAHPASGGLAHRRFRAADPAARSGTRAGGLVTVPGELTLNACTQILSGGVVTRAVLVSVGFTTVGMLLSTVVSVPA